MMKPKISKNMLLITLVTTYIYIPSDSSEPSLIHGGATKF